jgi:hypothetical protein
MLNRHEHQQKITDVKEAFGVDCYWSMAGCFCIEANGEHISLKPTEGGLWDKLSTAATALLDERAKHSNRAAALMELAALDADLIRRELAPAED